MNFKILEFSQDLPLTEDALLIIVEKINVFKDERSLLFSHMVINGEAKYTDALDYIAANIENIREIEAVLQTKSQYVSRLILELYGVLEQSISQIISLGKLFVFNNNEIWNELASFINEMQYLVQVYNEILKYRQELNSNHSDIDWRVIESAYNSFTGGLAVMNSYVEINDTVLVADMILYEIVPSLEKIHAILGERIEKEVNNA